MADVNSILMSRSRIRIVNSVTKTGLLSLSVVCVLAFLVLVPLVYVLMEALTNVSGSLTLLNIIDVLSMPMNVLALKNTFLLAAYIAIISLIFGFVFAFGLARTDMPFKKSLRAIIILSVMSPSFLTAFAYIVLLGPNSGAINQLLNWIFGLESNWGPLNIFSGWGFVVLSVPMGTGICVLQVLPSLERMDTSTEEASRILGVGPFLTLLKITMRLAKPALVSAFILTFAWATSLYGTPQILGLNVASISIRDSLLVASDLKAAAVLSLTLSVFALFAVFVYRISVASQERYATGGARGSRSGNFELRKWKYLIPSIGIVYAFIGFILPYGTLLYVSLTDVVSAPFSIDNLTLKNYAGIVGNEYVMDAIGNSLLLSLISALTLIIIGMGAGYILVRSTNRLRSSIEYLSIMPLGLAGTAFAMALLIAYVSPPLRALGITGTLLIIWLAYIAHFSAFGIRGIQSGLMQVSSELNEAARMCGAGPLQAFFGVDLRMSKTAVVSTAVLLFILCFPELGMSVILQSIDTQVVSTALMSRWQGTGGIQEASAMAIIVFGVVSIVIVGLYGFMTMGKSSKIQK